jgi:hypothetical protein
MVQAFAILRFQDSLARRDRPDMEETYKRVIGVLEREGVRWTVIGAHAVNTYAEPRATVDIDLVVDARKLKATLAALEREFGELVVDDIGAAERLMNLSVDLIRSDNHALFRAALDEGLDRGGVRVPPPELLIALKFLAATSPWRKVAERAQDIADLINVYANVGTDLDRGAMLAHAARIYAGADAELADLLDRVDRGEKISI